MSRTITIDPVTRIEGHARIHVVLDEQGFVTDAEFQVTQFRGFEKICQGRPFYEMPSLMARICGICPVSHLVASAKACDALLAVRIPEAAVRLRSVMNLAQLIQSHALSFFYLSAPDLLLGMDAEPERRNLFGLARDHGALVRSGIQLRAFGQKLIEALGSKRIHPGWIVPGGVQTPMSGELRDRVRAEIPQMQSYVRRALDWLKTHTRPFAEEVRSFANFPSLFMGLVNGSGHLEHYDGALRIVDGERRSLLGPEVVATDYPSFIEERNEEGSYLKSTFYKPWGYPEGIYRVGPLARLNVADRCGTAGADQELAELRGTERRALLSSFYYHHARLIEALFGLEKLEQLLADDRILASRVRAVAEPNASEGVGVSEAPRGTLMHRYWIDDNGLMTKADLIIATGHNNLAMNRGVLQVAKHFIADGEVTEGALNRIEAVIRCFDPCLSCSTHAVGQMPLLVSVYDAAGTIVDQVARSPEGLFERRP